MSPITAPGRLASTAKGGKPEIGVTGRLAPPDDVVTSYPPRGWTDDLVGGGAHHCTGQVWHHLGSHPAGSRSPIIYRYALGMGVPGVVIRKL